MLHIAGTAELTPSLVSAISFCDKNIESEFCNSNETNERKSRPPSPIIGARSERWEGASYSPAMPWNHFPRLEVVSG